MLNKLKALVCLVQCFAFVSAFTACSSELSVFDKALDKAPAFATVSTSLDSVLGELCAEYSAVYLSDAIEIEYTKDVLGEIGEGSSIEEIKISAPGNVRIDKDGKPDGDIGALVLSVITRDINLDKSVIDYTVDGEVLSFAVNKENTVAVFGVDLGYDIEAEIKLNGGTLSEIHVFYTTSSGTAKLEAYFE